MPFQPAPNIAQARFVAEYFGDTVINDMYFLKPAADITLSELQALAVILETSYAATILPWLSEDFNHIRVDMRDLTFQNSWVISDNSGSGVGGLTGNGMPGNVTLSVKFSTAFAGRSFRGGNHVSGLIESNVTGNSIAVDWAANIVSGYNDMIAAVNVAAVFTPVVLSRVEAGVVLPEAVGRQIINASVSNYKVHTQRTRVNGR